MTRLLSFGAIWIFYVQVIGGNKSLCPSGETVAANSVHGTPFLAFKLGFCRHSGNLNRGRSVRRMSFCMHRSEEHTSELQSHLNLVCRLLLEKKKETLDSATIQITGISAARDAISERESWFFLQSVINTFVLLTLQTLTELRHPTLFINTQYS